MRPSIGWLLISLCTTISIAPGGAQAQARNPIFVLEVPVELRTLSPEVTGAFVECSLFSRERGIGDYTVGTARSPLRLMAESTGGRASEVVNVVFEIGDMIGDPVHPVGYACPIVLSGGDRAEWPAVMSDTRPALADGGEASNEAEYESQASESDTTQAGASEPDTALVGHVRTRQGIDPKIPSWTHMQWASPTAAMGRPIEILGDLVLREVVIISEAIFQAWVRAGQGGSPRGNNDHGDPE